MKKTNLKSTRRLLGQKSGFCYRDALYSKALLFFALCLLPAMIFAQGNKQEQLKEKEARNQAYLDAKHGNKPEDVQAKQIQSISQEIEDVESNEIPYEVLLQKLNFNEEKALNYGYSKAQIAEMMQQEILAMENAPKGNNTPDMYARQGSNDCAAAVDLTCHDVAIAGTTVGASNTGFINCGGGASGGTGVWYKVIGDHYNNTVSVTGSGGFLPRVHVYSSTNGDCNSIQCAGGTSGQGTSSATFFALGGDTYYVYVTGGANNQGGYHITLTTSDPSGCQTVNSDGLSSATAFSIACGDFDSSDSTNFGNTEVGPVCNGSAASNGVWYVFNVDASYPSGSGVTVELCGSSYDTELHIYESASLNCVDSNDDSCGLQSRVSFGAQPGVDYYIYVGAYSSGSGPYDIAVICDGNVPPPPPQVPNNDLCETPLEIECSGSDQVILGSTILATDINEPQSCDYSWNGPGVWYSIEGDNSSYIITTCGFDTVISVYSSTSGLSCDISSYECLDSADFSSGEPNCNSQATINFDTEDGEMYFIYVAGWSSFSGAQDFELRVTCIPPPEPPGNDLCADAEDIECGDTVSGHTGLATSEGALPFCDSDAATNSPGVWYAFTGTGDLVDLDLIGQTYDAVISVYTGGCNGLTCVGGENGDFSDDSQYRFLSEDGTDYLIFVSGFEGATGAYSLDVFCQPDPCSTADQISCEDTVVYGNNSGENGSTAGPTDFCGTSPGNIGVFYEFIGGGEFVNINTCGSSFDTKLNVYSGACGALVCLTGNDDTSLCAGTSNESEVDFFANDGESYFIWVASYSDFSVGAFQLNITCQAAVANDLCEDAVALGCGTSITGTTELSTKRDAPEEDCQGTQPENGVWYTVVGQGGDILLSTCDAATYDTSIIVYTGECGDLTCYAGNDDGAGCSNGTSEVQFLAESGETYYIYVSGFGEQRGTYTLTVDCLCFADDSSSECTTIYDGYTSEYGTETLTGTLLGTDGDVTYLWSPGNETTQSILVDAADGTQNYVVTMTDEYGCTSTQSFFVLSIDIDCDRSPINDMVEVCHNGVTICVADSAIASHLNHGDSLGACGTELCEEYTPFCDVTAISPTNGEIDVDANVTIQWSAATGVVDGYRLSIGTSSGADDVVSNLDLGNSLSYDASLGNLTTYYYTVTPYNSNGDGAGCSEFSFTTINDPFRNDDCDLAIALTVNAIGDECNEVFNADHTTITSSGHYYSCDSGGTNYDTFYTFVAPDSGTVDFSVVLGSQSGTVEKALLSGCNGTQFSCGGGNTDRFENLTPGNTYTLAVWFDNFYTQGTFTICLNEFVPPPAPDNDDCSGAIAIVCDEVVTGSTESATSQSLSTCGTSLSTAPGVWYSFVGTGGAITASLCNSGFDTKIGVFTGSCGNLVCVDGNDDNSAACGSGFRSELVFSSVLDEDYLIYVTGFSANAGYYELEITCADPPPPPSGLCNDMTVNINTASWASEMSWNIKDSGNATVASGSGYANNTNYSISVSLPNDSYTFEMIDSYGDGWNGGTFSVVDGDAVEIASGGLGSGSFGTVNFSVNCSDDPPSSVCNDMTVNINTASWASEMSWNLKDSGNATVASGSGYSNNTNYSIGVSLPNDSYTFEMIDSYGDGWNGGTFSVVDGDSVTIASGGLGSGSFGTVNFSVNCSGARLANPELAWSMSPNPSRGQVTLGLEDFVNNDVNVMVLDLAGNVVLNRRVRDLQNPKLDIELRGVPYGMYFVRIISNDTVSTKKLIINN